MAVPKLQVTKNYRLFNRSIENRPTEAKKRKRLIRSMQRYGFIPCFPVGCVRDKSGSLVVYDGQHRIEIAESLGLPVYYVVLEQGFDIAEVNCAVDKWNVRNYAERFIAQGKQAYKIGVELASLHAIPITTAFSLLAGTTSFNNCQDDYYHGQFKVKDADWANRVASLYSQIVQICPSVKGVVLIGACMAVCRVPGFDHNRLIAGCKRCREKLVPYAKRDGALNMLEEVYNFGRSSLFSLKNEAIMAMRERNVTISKSERAK